MPGLDNLPPKTLHPPPGCAACPWPCPAAARAPGEGASGLARPPATASAALCNTPPPCHCQVPAVATHRLQRPPEKCAAHQVHSMPCTTVTNPLIPCVVYAPEESKAGRLARSLMKSGPAAQCRLCMLLVVKLLQAYSVTGRQLGHDFQQMCLRLQGGACVLVNGKPLQQLAVSLASPEGCAAS